MAGLRLALFGIAFTGVTAAEAAKVHRDPVMWLNSFRHASAYANGTFGSPTRLDTLYANLNGATQADVAIASACTTMTIPIDKWVLPPSYSNAAASLDSSYVIARLVVYTDSTVAQNLTACTFLVDVLPGTDHRALDVTAPTGVEVQSTAYTTMNSQPVYSFPIKASRLAPGTALAGYVANPGIIGGLHGHTGIRVRIASMTGILRKARAEVVYWTED